ncbi:GFA family protein [Fodinicurvata fenggangensis]|uniref:GFA family protein n=1 Tax=Fodinicurvata fenggangensis TaxID=1121830 RepID=UPI0004787D63|nr:GFA family protein [Fodinicurvata fenggangensis]
MVQDGNAAHFEGGCTCGRVRYRMTARPLFVHGCHCRWCQRETGSALAINALVETASLELLVGQPELTLTPSESGRGQKILRCPDCRVALWSHYPGAGEKVAFLRVGTLDDPDRFPPDIHIYTDSKQHWLSLPSDVPVMPQYYRRSEHWPAESLERWKVLRDY